MFRVNGHCNIILVNNSFELVSGSGHSNKHVMVLQFQMSQVASENISEIVI